MPEAHTRARGSVLSRSIGLTRCGDRPGGQMPAGMSRNHVPFAKERQNYTLSRRVAQGGMHLEVPQNFRGWRGDPAPSADFATPPPDGRAENSRRGGPRTLPIPYIKTDYRIQQDEQDRLAFESCQSCNPV